MLQNILWNTLKITATQFITASSAQKYLNTRQNSWNICLLVNRQFESLKKTFLDHNLSEYKTPAAELESALEFARTNYLNSKNGNVDNLNKIFTDEELSDEEER